MGSRRCCSPCELAVEGVEFEVLAVVHVVRLVGVAGGEEDDLVRRAVVERAQAHRAGVGEDVDGGADQVLGAQLHAGLADGEDLGVRGGVIGLGDLVGGLCDDLAVLDDHGRERPAAFLDVVAGEVDGALCEVHHGSSIPSRADN